MLDASRDTWTSMVGTTLLACGVVLAAVGALAVVGVPVIALMQACNAGAVQPNPPSPLTSAMQSRPGAIMLIVLLDGACGAAAIAGGLASMRAAHTARNAWAVIGAAALMANGAARIWLGQYGLLISVIEIALGAAALAIVFTSPARSGEESSM